MALRIAPLVLLALALAPSSVLAQGCCTPGSSPLGGLAGFALRPGNVELGFAIEGYELGQAYEGSDSVEDPAARHSEVLSTTLYARVGVHSRVAVILRLPYEYRMREQTLSLGSFTVDQKFSNTAVGDLMTLVIARALPFRPFASWGVHVGGGVKWPTGPYDRTQGDLVIPVELQTGTGSTDPVLTLLAYQTWATASVTSSALVRFPREGKSGYEYGNDAQFSVLGLWSWRPTIGLGLEVRGRIAAADKFRGREAINTGGSRWMTGPRVLAEFPSTRLGFEAAFLMPVHQDLRGLQLGVDGQASLLVRWRAL